MKLGIAYVTEDRRGLGLTMPMSITTNITLPTLRRYTNRYGLVQRKEESSAPPNRTASKLNIRTPSVEQSAGTLSGGNQQKVVLSKWLNAQPRLLILDEPTRGIDVRAKAEVHHIISDLAAAGHGHHPDLVRPARSAGHERPRRGHARGAADGHLYPQRGHTGDGYDGSDGAT
jgi:rhamnose transport system ATP-binding protein